MALYVSLLGGVLFVVFGAVVGFGVRRTNLILQNKVSLLREKDIIQEEEVTTPARRIYFAIMLMYLDQDSFHNYYDEFVLRMTEFMNAIEDGTATQNCLSISRDVMSKDYYRALVTCRKLFDFEAERLNYVPAA
jgi:flagellar protein FlbT